MTTSTQCKAKNPATCPYHGVKAIQTLSTSSFTTKEEVIESVFNREHKTANVTNYETGFTQGFLNFNDEQNNLNSDMLLLNIPVEQRPRILQNVDTSEQLHQVYANLQTTLLSTLDTEKLSLTTSRNNREGSDYYEASTNTSVEMKLGAATDVNVGFDKPAKLLFTEEGSSLFPSKDDRTEWRGKYLKGDSETIKKEHDGKLKSVRDFINKNLANKPLSPQGNHLLSAYYCGITNFDEINSSWEKNSSPGRKVRRFVLNSDLNWSETTRKNVPVSWNLKEAVFTDNGRLTIYFTNEKTAAKLKMVYNYKNDYKYKDGTKVEAKLGLGSPSFNGWFKE